MPVDTDAVGDGVADGDAGVLVAGAGDDAGAVGDAGGLDGGVTEASGVGVPTGVGEWWRGLPVLVATGPPARVVGGGADGLTAGVFDGDVDAGTGERLAAADAEFWLTWADTFAGVTTRGVELETSWPTRLTAVKVTAVTSAHDMIQPMASVSGRVDQFRGLIALIGRTTARRRRVR